MDESAGPDDAPRGGQVEGRALRRSVRELLSLTDGLRSDIEGVWNQTPDELAALADWSDALAEQQGELAAFLSRSCGAVEADGGIGRIGREIAREMAAVFSPGGRLGRLVRTANRLLAAQTELAEAAGHPDPKALLDRHGATTRRHLARMTARRTVTR